MKLIERIHNADVVLLSLNLSAYIFSNRKCIRYLVETRLCVFYLILHDCGLQIKNFFRIKLDFLKFVRINGTSRVMTRRMPIKLDRRSEAFSRFLSPGVIQENGIRENTSYTAPISIDLPSFRSVRSYGQIFRSACLPSPIPLDDGSLDEFKVNLGHETVLWRARGVGRRRSRATCHREPPGSVGLTLISLLR